MESSRRERRYRRWMHFAFHRVAPIVIIACVLLLMAAGATMLTQEELLERLYYAYAIVFLFFVKLGMMENEIKKLKKGGSIPDLQERVDNLARMLREQQEDAHRRQLILMEEQLDSLRQAWFQSQEEITAHHKERQRWYERWYEPPIDAPARKM